MRDILKYFDKFTFFVLLLLVSMGVILIYSASTAPAQTYWSKQLVWLGFSLAAFILVFRVKTENAFKISILAYFGLLGVLALQIIAGEIIAGTKSWIKAGMFNIQVSEFVKIPLALYLARLLPTMDTIDWKHFFKLSALIGGPFVLIAAQPDLGTASMLFSFFLVTVLLKKIKPVIIVFLLVAMAIGSFTAWNYILKPYQRARILSFLEPEKYKKSSGYQIIQSKIAIGSGGLNGKGYMKGTQSQYKFLPTRHTDFIVSVLGEEFGFLGISFFLMCFFVFFYRQFNIRVQSDEEFFFIYLFNGIILCQFLVNVLMTIGLVPVLGVPLPFISYGGSSMLAFFVGEALIFRMKINTYLNEL